MLRESELRERERERINNRLGTYQDVAMYFVKHNNFYAFWQSSHLFVYELKHIYTEIVFGIYISNAPRLLNI